MTINIGINLKKYILIAADTRVTYFHPLIPGKEFYFDEENKIKLTKLGLITGAGRIDILNMVEKGLANRDIIHTDGILGLINETIKSLPANISQKEIDMTGWLLSYQATENGEPVLRCALIHPYFDYKLHIVYENKGISIAPIEANVDVADRIVEIINDKIKPIDDLSQLNDNITYNCNWIQSMLDILSNEYNSICSTYSIGVHLIDGSTGISEIIKDGKLSLEIK